MKKVIANNLSSGDIIKHDNEIYCVLNVKHIKPGKGGAFIKAELRKTDSAGSKIVYRFRSSEKVAVVFVTENEYTYLYHTQDSIFVIDGSGEIVFFPIDLIGDKVALLQDGIILIILYFEDKPVSIRLPKSIKVKVTEADPSIKGQTASASFKSSIVNNAYKIQVPLFVSEGDEIIISSEDLTYISKA